MNPQIITLPVGDFQTNCYLVFGPDRVGVVIDPGGEAQHIAQVLAERQIKATAILLTHGHCDHLIGAAQLQELLDLPLYLSEADLPTLEGSAADASFLGLPFTKVPKATGYLKDGQIFKAGQLEFKVLATPGHTPGGIVLLCGDCAFCGDTIFENSVGRTDLPGGDSRQLANSIRRQIYTLPDSTTLYPGHGPTTTVGLEKRSNPFVRPL